MPNNPIPNLEEMSDGSVLRAVRLLNNVKYTYVWLKTPKGWFVTGSPAAHKDESLAKWLHKVVLAEPIQTVSVTGWADVKVYDVT